MSTDAASANDLYTFSTQQRSDADKNHAKHYLLADGAWRVGDEMSAARATRWDRWVSELDMGTS